ncbi:MAG: 4-(cytidine 5'-diphospho)-2-C-methyl-D-erythritol kinase [Cytophagales bacterium]|nr:MAG: 4-(cytidine 5'-diphospho)-2-C-methyl-D-erythritol kinase [Cytophagales bacterium]
MIRFPNAKINLGLQITERRTDNFHNICSVFYPLGWSDALEIIPSKDFEYSQSGITISGNTEDNLIVKTYRWMKKAYDLSNVKIHLHKNIPIGAGLGGGSSDAAFTAKMLNEIFSLKLSIPEMEEIIKPLGSDCAFFIQNKPTLALQKGDEFENINVSLKGKYIVLIYPNIFVSTKEAYAGVKPQKPQFNLRNIAELPIQEWRNNLKNDFEEGIFFIYPEIAELKNQFYQLGALYSSMSGSGSTVFGIFDGPINCQKYFNKDYSIWAGALD